MIERPEIGWYALVPRRRRRRRRELQLYLSFWRAVLQQPRLVLVSDFCDAHFEAAPHAGKEEEEAVEEELERASVWY